MNIKKLSTLAGLIIFAIVLNGCANSNFNKKYNKPFKHNTPLIKDQILYRQENQKFLKRLKWVQNL